MIGRGRSGQSAGCAENGPVHQRYAELLFDDAEYGLDQLLPSLVDLPGLVRGHQSPMAAQ